MAKIDYDLDATAADFQSKLTVGDNGSIKAEDGAIETLLPEGKSMTDLIEAQNIISKIVTVGSLAAGRASIEAFKGNKELTETEFKVKVGHDTLKINVAREGETSDGKGGRKKVFGQERIAYLVSGGPSVGTLKKVRETIKSEAASALAD